MTEDGPRRARRDDVPALVALMVEFYAEAELPLAEVAATNALLGLIDRPDLGEIWLLEENGAPAGHLVLTFGYSMEFGGLRAFVDDFFVRPESRGRGLGKTLLDAVRMACLERDVRALVVETGLEDHPARSLYARAGFVDQGRVLLTQPLTPALHER